MKAKPDNMKQLEKMLLANTDVAQALIAFFSEQAEIENNYYTEVAKRALFESDLKDRAKISYGKTQAYENIIAFLSNIKHK